jgi:hypothetical protein
MAAERSKIVLGGQAVACGSDTDLLLLLGPGPGPSMPMTAAHSVDEFTIELLNSLYVNNLAIFTRRWLFPEIPQQAYRIVAETLD